MARKLHQFKAYSYNSFFILILIVSIVLRLVILYILPPGENPDEPFIYERIWRFVTTGIDPSFHIQGSMYFPNNEYYYPPLYFLLASVAVKPVLFFSNNISNINEAFLKSYVPLRIMSLLISVGSLFFIWKILVNFKISNYLKRSVFIFIALLPTYVAFSVSPNHNVLLFFFISVFLYLLLSKKWVSTNLRQTSFLGIIVGLALLTKLEGVLLFISFFVFLYFQKVAKSLKHSLVFLFWVLIVAGWWFAINIAKTGWFYNQELFSAALKGYTLPYSFPGYLSKLSDWTFETFLITYGSTNNVRLSSLGYMLLYLFLIISFAGIIKTGLRRIRSLMKSQKSFYWTLIIFFVVNILIFLHVNLNLVFQPQGRYLFPSLLFLAIVITYGLSGWLKKNKLYLLPWSVFILFLFFNLWGLGCIYFVYRHISLLPPLLECVNYR